MDIIISFFRNIDGWPYYIILVVNAILIFAIIGYLAEKNNEQLMKLGMNTDVPNLNNSNANVTVSPQVNQSNGLSIPKVAPTLVNNPQPLSANPNNIAPNQPVIPPTPATGTPVVQNPIPVNNGGVNPSFNNNSVPLQNLNQNQNSVITPTNNAIDPNEKAPAVLVINSNSSNKDVK